MFETGDLSNTHKMINYSFQHFLQQNLNWFLSWKEKRLCTGSFIWKPNETFIWKYWDWKFNISCQKPKLYQRELGVQYEPLKINGILHGAFSFFLSFFAKPLIDVIWWCSYSYFFYALQFISECFLRWVFLKWDSLLQIIGSWKTAVNENWHANLW